MIKLQLIPNTSKYVCTYLSTHLCVCQVHNVRSLPVNMFVHTVSQGYGQFLENRIHCNTYAGVWVTGESEPTLKDNEICDGQQGGVYFFGNGRGLLEGNNIHGNALAGIQIRSGSNPIIRNNQIHHGQHGGLYVVSGWLL